MCPIGEIWPTWVFFVVARPAPLSTVVHRSMKVKAITQATLINSVLNKVHEVRMAAAEDDFDDEDMPRYV